MELGVTQAPAGMLSLPSLTCNAHVKVSPPRPQASLGALNSLPACLHPPSVSRLAPPFPASAGLGLTG